MCQTCKRRLIIVGTYPIPETEKEPSTIDVPQVRHCQSGATCFSMPSLGSYQIPFPDQINILFDTLGGTVYGARDMFRNG